MSFMLTTDQVRNRTKTVTRRVGWWNLKTGDRLIAAVKCQGLKKGEKREDIGIIEVVRVSHEELQDITSADCSREGFPDMTPAGFVAMFSEKMLCDKRTCVNRIEFKYCDA